MEEEIEKHFDGTKARVTISRTFPIVCPDHYDWTPSRRVEVSEEIELNNLEDGDVSPAKKRIGVLRALYREVRDEARAYQRDLERKAREASDIEGSH